MVVLESILSLGLPTGSVGNKVPEYRFQYNGRQVQVKYMGSIGEKALYQCNSPRFGGMIVEGTLTGDSPQEQDYLSAASNAFDELEMREPTEPFKLQSLEVITIGNAADLMRVQAHFLDNSKEDDYY